MNQSLTLYLLFSLLILSASCNKNKDGFEQTESGLWYNFIESNDGPKPQEGDIMLMEILYLTDRDSVLFDSKSKGDSFKVVLVPPTFRGGVEEGFAMMGIGDSAHFKSSADSIFTKTFHGALPEYMKPGSLVTFRVRLKNFISKRIADSVAQAQDVQKRAEEFEKIEAYLKENNMDVSPTENGAYLLTTVPGKGNFPVKGDTILVNYTGRLLDGTVFDQKLNKEEPLEIVLGSTTIIKGWEECLPFLNKGSVARMLLPSDLAYGGKEYGKLPAYSTLVFEVEILDIKPGNR